MRKNYDAESIKQNTNSWKVFLSENDPYILYEKAKEHFDLIGVDQEIFHEAGHFCSRDGYSTFPTLFDSFDHIHVYTTRVDTVYSMAFAVVAPDHPKVQDFIAPEQREVCEDYIRNTKAKTDLDRTNDGKDKTGVFSGSSVINPYNGESVPLWIGDFVLGTYGTGAVFGDAHDERDFEFANKYGIPLKQSIAKLVKLTGISAMRSDVETLERKIVDVILENDKGEFLLIEENHPKDFHFIG